MFVLVVGDLRFQVLVRVLHICILRVKDIVGVRVGVLVHVLVGVIGPIPVPMGMGMHVAVGMSMFGHLSTPFPFRFYGFFCF